MPCTERIAYHIGEVIGDAILISMFPTAGFAYFKVTTKISKIACEHKIISTCVDAVSENLFECLPFLE